MWLVYFILTLDAVTKAAILFAVFTGLGWLLTFIMSCVATAQQNSDNPDFGKDDKKVIDKIKNGCLSIFIPCLFIALFIPNSKQLALIYTAGNAIEYIQGNEKIKELPDKAVQCLDLNRPKYVLTVESFTLSPVTPKEQKEFDDFCKSQGKIWNKETLQWEKYKWEPKRGETYWCIDAMGKALQVTYNTNAIDPTIVEFGNCFQTKEQAQKAAEKVKELLKSL